MNLIVYIKFSAHDAFQE